MKPKKLHPAEQYAHDVVAGRLVASRYVRLACQRHLRDLTDGKRRGLYFDAAAAQHALDVTPHLNHSKGEWAGKPMQLEPWEQFILWSLFGWMKAGGLRRFNTAYVSIGRKNGKSTIGAIVSHLLAFFDGEPGAEVYCVATKKDQARIVFDEAARMRKASPALAKRILAFRNNLNNPLTNSKLEPLSSDEDSLDGLNIHGAIVDEYHAHKTRKLIDVIETATAARRQPLIFKITTAGYDRETACWQDHEYGQKVLEGLNSDDSLFVFIACLDKDDDWKDERNWMKGNPNLGVSCKIDDLRRKANKARQDPSALNSFLRLHLNVWTSQDQAAIDPDAWNACVGFSLKDKDSKVLRAEMEQQLEGRPCYIGVDLASTEDIAASVKLFPPVEENQPYIVIPHFWLPEDNLEKKMKQWQMPYDVWQREGFIETTEGNVVDYDAIEKQIMRDCSRYDVREITVDPWAAPPFTNNLYKAGIASERIVLFKQTMENFAPPTKQLLEVLIPNRQIAHLGNPVLRWMANNLVVWQDGNGSKRPTKKSSKQKIDGMVALIMAIGRAGANPDAGPSVYETRGVLVL